MEIDASDPQVTLSFYKRLYPFNQIFQWLNHNQAPSNLFTHREFSFTLIGDVYLRYHSFNKVEDLKANVIRLNPTRFEIGAVYTARPKDKKTVPAGGFKPALRELVFDIDMTDYDEIRTCCKGKGICHRCWGFIAAAVKVLDHSLREDFGYRHLLWIYSGRRGIHCWISDQSALALTDEERRAVLSWLEVIKGGKEMSRKVNVRQSTLGKPSELHPALNKAYDLLGRPFADIILEDQDCFGTREGWEALLKLIPDKGVVSKLRAKWDDDPNSPSRQKWDDFLVYLGHDKTGTLKAAAEDIVLQYTYPRLDVEVSKHRNHLLKAPFCIHPATGRICVPVDPKKVDQFNPEDVPTVGKLLEQLADVPRDEADPEGNFAWQKTDLRPYVAMLEMHVAEIMSESRSRRKAAVAKMEF